MQNLLLALFLSASINVMGQYTNFGNTAFDYCRLLGHELVVDQSINRTFCVIPNGNLVNPWDFFKGKVGQEYSYCAKEGYTIRTKYIEDNGATYAIPICDKKIKSISLMELLSKNPKYDELFENDPIGSKFLDTVIIDSDQRRPPPQVCKGPDNGYAINFDWNDKNGDDFDNDPENQGIHGICYAMVTASIAETM